MSTLTPEGRRLVHDLARRHGFGEEAVTRMLAAVLVGNGRMAQFNHPEFGGSGQWMSGGMLMLGDMFNHELKSRVAGLCADLSGALSSSDALVSTDAAASPTRPRRPDRDHAGEPSDRTRSRGSDRPSRDETSSHPGRSQGRNDQHRNVTSSHQSQSSSHQSQGQGTAGNEARYLPDNPFFTPSASSTWWPRELGRPTATGSQNSMRYAYFADACRLAVERDGDVRVHDTLDHRIGGFSQQQSRTEGISLSSQHGTVDLDSLPIVSDHGETRRGPSSDRQSSEAPHPAPETARSGEDRAGANAPARGSDAGTPPEADTSSTIDRGGSADVSESDASASDGPTVATKEDPLRTIERLGQLHGQGLLTDEEFTTKKQELLSRL